ncbi:MAG: AI-2E family transporter [Pyrinomonadaceae bacterium]|nr:AI-2E family transporter [Pyrinomonadaceae bacterium]
MRKATDGGRLTRERALTLVLLVATAIAFYVCYRLTLTFLPALAWGLALAIVAHPLHSFIARRIKRPNIAAGLAVLLVAGHLVAPAVFVLRQLAREAVRGAEMVREEIASGRWRAAVESNPRLAPALHWLEEEANLRGAAEQLTNAIPVRISRFLTGSIWAAAEILITLFALFYFFRDRQAILRAVRSFVPLSDAKTDEVFRRVTETIHATIYGTLVVALVQGALGGLMFWWLGLPAPLLWGAVMELLAIVQILGAFVVWVPAELAGSFPGLVIRARTPFGRAAPLWTPQLLWMKIFLDPSQASCLVQQVIYRKVNHD